MVANIFEMKGDDWLIERAGDGSVASGWSEMELPQPRNLAVKEFISMQATHNGCERIGVNYVMQ